MCQAHDLATSSPHGVVPHSLGKTSTAAVDFVISKLTSTGVTCVEARQAAIPRRSQTPLLFSKCTHGVDVKGCIFNVLLSDIPRFELFFAWPPGTGFFKSNGMSGHSILDVRTRTKLRRTTASATKQVEGLKSYLYFE